MSLLIGITFLFAMLCLHPVYIAKTTEGVLIVLLLQLVYLLP